MEVRELQFPAQGSNLDPLYWESRVLDIGPPGKALIENLLSAYAITAIEGTFKLCKIFKWQECDSFLQISYNLVDKVFVTTYCVCVCVCVCVCKS